MHFSHSPDIWQQFPTLKAGVVVVDGIRADADVCEDVEALFERARTRLAESDEGQMPEIQAWRQVYSNMGLKPTKYRCAAESLLRRFKKEDSLPSFHPVIDLCNALSLAYATPIAVIDTAYVDGGITVRHATGDETYLDFSGEVLKPDENEVIFVDDANTMHSRRWCFRQSKTSVVRESTKQVLIVAEAHHETAEEDMDRLMEELGGLMERYFEISTDQSSYSSKYRKYSSGA